MSTLELRRKRAALVQQARDILNAANGGGLSSEQRTQYDAIMADVDALKARIDAEEQLSSLETELQQSRREPNRPELRGTQNGSDRLASVEYGNAFSTWARAMELTPEQKELLYQHRAQSAVTGSAGGYTVPQGFVASLEAAMKDFSGVLQAPVQVMPTASGNDLPWPTVNDTGNEGEQVDENTAVTGQDVAFGRLVFKAYKFSSKTVLVPFELIQDSAFNIERDLSPILGERIGRTLNKKFTTGAGSTTPNGLVTASVLGKTTAAVAAVTYDEVLDLQHSVDPAYRRRPTTGYMFNDATLKALKQLKDSQNRPLWLPGTAVREPDTINGYPYFINQDMASMGTGNKFMLFGDFSKYKVRRVMSIELFRIVDKYIEQGSVGFLAYARFDANLLDAGTNPIKHMKNA